MELGAGIIGMGRKKRLSSHLSKRRLSEQARADVDESQKAIADHKRQIAELEKRREEIVSEINDRWGHVVNDITEVSVKPKKTDVFVKLFGVVWMPYYVVNTGAEGMELPAFGEM
jgi:hypothetical protein